MNQIQRNSGSFQSFPLQATPVKGGKHYQKNPVLIESSPKARKREVESK
jgi:hypothetical protein